MGVRAARIRASRASRSSKARTLGSEAAAHAAAQPRELVEDAADASAEADERLSELQDSMRPVEVGDAELRAGLAEVREALGAVQDRADAFLRTLGR